MPSSVILAMRYEPIREELVIAFRERGVAYRYFNVPVEEWEAFLEAESKGTYLNRVFKAKEHPYERTEEVVYISGRKDAELRLEWGESEPSRKRVQRVAAPKQGEKATA
jgi:KTSC domain-containing protein